MSTAATATAQPEWPAWTAPAQRFEPMPGPESISGALAWLQALGEHQAWPPKTLFALTLCADEALANIVPQPNQPLHLWLACGPTAHGLALRIEDNGVAFDPTAQASPDLAASLDEAQVGGHGLRLMRHYLHQMLYRREALRNVLLLEVALEP